MGWIVSAWGWTTDHATVLAAVVSALATVAVAWFTITLARSTEKLWRISVKQAEIAGKEFISNHRPRIILRDVTVVDTPDGQEILYMLVNSGGTTGTIVESWIFAETVKKNEPTRNLRSYGYNDLGQLTFAAGEMKDFTCRPSTDVRWHLVVNSLPSLPAGSVEHGADYALYFIGAILYSDDDGNRRRSVFRRRWDNETKVFVRVNDPDQEYAD